MLFFLAKALRYIVKCSTLKMHTSLHDMFMVWLTDNVLTAIFSIWATLPLNWCWTCPFFLPSHEYFDHVHHCTHIHQHTHTCPILILNTNVTKRVTIHQRHMHHHQGVKHWTWWSSLELTSWLVLPHTL